jgi:hypothetical protein
MNDCGSSTWTRTSTTPERLVLFSRVPACGSRATFASRRVQLGVAGL